jgi:PEP-CTERM motif
MHRLSHLTVRACALFAALIAGSPQMASAGPAAGSMQEPFADYGEVSFSNITPPSGSQNGGGGWNLTGTPTAHSLNASWGATLNAGVLRSVTSPGLEYTATGYLPGSGNKLTLDAASTNVTQNIGRRLGDQVIDSGTTFFSFLVSRNTPDTIRTINLAFFNDTNERFAIGQIGAAAGNTNGNIGFLMNNSNPAGLVVGATPIAMGTGVTHLIVGRIDWDAAANETVSMWVDPTNVTSQAVAGAPYASTNGFELIALTRIRPFVGNTAGGFNGVSANFDEIRIGDSWESVTSVLVPEPGAMTVIGMGLIGLLSARRGRRTLDG